jgi:hypothetical protein
MIDLSCKSSQTQDVDDHNIEGHNVNEQNPEKTIVRSGRNNIY